MIDVLNWFVILSKFMHSEIQNQLAGLLIDVLFLPKYKLPKVQLRPLKEHMFSEKYVRREPFLWSLLSVWSL